MEKHYIFVLVAKFAAGKTTIAKLLEDRYGLKRAITSTTRKKREGERDGIDYYFYDDATFEKEALKGNLAAINRIPKMNPGKDVSSSLKEKVIHKCNAILDELTKRDTSKDVEYVKKYGLPIDKLDLENCSYICALEPSGYKELVNQLGKDKVKGIYLKLSDKERWLRALNREINPDVDGIVDKYIEEKVLYDGFELISDKIIDNVGTSDNATVEIYEYMQSLK